ncbi:MAG: hypothetical protein PVF05_10420 [Gemmatimonadales bacterium]|jgi:hypothetical protein
MSRGGVAWLIVAAWLAAMGWNARREWFRPEAERLALGAATLPPGAAYYTLDVGDRPAGMLSLEIDTLPGRRGFRLLEQAAVRLPGLGGAGETETRTETWMGPGITFDSLVRRSIRGDDTAFVRIWRRGDTLRRAGPADTTELRVADAASVQTPISWPLRYVAAGGDAPGEVVRIAVLDPASGGVRDFDLTTREVGTRVFADSADTDADGRWIVAGRDTVRAWRIEQSSAGDAEPGRVADDVWVDEDGRYVEAGLAGGLRMRRTAFELAFFRETR